MLEQLLSLKANKAIGLDKISARLPKVPAHKIAPSVVRLLNLLVRAKSQHCLSQVIGLVFPTTAPVQSFLH